MATEDLSALREDAEFMRSKLAETRRALAEQSVVIPYDNGGGQAGIRANPAFAEYERLARAYHATLRCIAEVGGKGAKKRQGGSLASMRDDLKAIRGIA